MVSATVAILIERPLWRVTMRRVGRARSELRLILALGALVASVARRVASAVACCIGVGDSTSRRLLIGRSSARCDNDDDEARMRAAVRAGGDCGDDDEDECRRASDWRRQRRRLPTATRARMPTAAREACKNWALAAFFLPRSSQRRRRQRWLVAATAARCADADLDARRPVDARWRRAPR